MCPRHLLPKKYLTKQNKGETYSLLFVFSHFSKDKIVYLLQDEDQVMSLENMSRVNFLKSNKEHHTLRILA